MMKQVKNKLLILVIAIVAFFHSVGIAQNNQQRYYVNNPHFDPNRPCCQWVVPITTVPTVPPFPQYQQNNTIIVQNNVGYQQQIQKDNCSYMVVYDNADDYNTNSQIQQLANCQ